MKILKLLGIGVLFIVIVLLIGNIWYRDLVDPYFWDKDIRKDVARQGFELVTEIKGGDRVMPWTLLKPYTRSIFFVNPSSKRNFRGYFAAETISFSRDNKGYINTWKGINLFDCESKIFTILSDENGEYSGRLFRADGGPMKQWWVEMGDGMVSYFCR